MCDAYTYLLYHKPTNQFYYGVRWRNQKLDLSPEEDLWKVYFSSSFRVKDLIEQYGKSSFDYQIRKRFSCEKRAIDWETKVLTRMKVLENPDKWLNRNAGNAILLDEKAKEKIRIYNADPATKKKRSQRIKGDKNPACRPEVQEKIKKTLAKTRKKAKEEGTMWYSPEYVAKRKENFKGKKNPRAKKFKLTDPQGKEYIVHGTLKKFASEHGLSNAGLRDKARDKDTTPTVEGWVIEELESSQKGQNRIHINNGKEQKMCLIEELPAMLEQGWQKGFIPRKRSKIDPESLRKSQEKRAETLQKRKEAGWESPLKGKPLTGKALESRQKSGLKRRGTKLSAETKAKIGEANRNRIVSEETRKKLSAASKGANNPMYGKPRSEEVKAKIRATKAAKKLTNLPNNFESLFDEI